jgi:predicted RNA binding protein YcfA (HicA-like mRNA interferase family)
MKVPRDLSGQELIKILCRDWAYTQVNQDGSHVILETEDPSHHRIGVPAHKALRIGTLNSILRSIARHKGIGKEDLLKKQ